MSGIDLAVLLFSIFTGFGFLAFAFFYTVPSFGPPVAVFFIVAGVLLAGSDYQDDHTARKTVSSVIQQLPKKTTISPDLSFRRPAVIPFSIQSGSVVSV